MKKPCILFIWSCVAFLHADESNFSEDRLTSFYDAFLCEEKNELAQAGLTSSCTGSERGTLGPFPTPPAPNPPPNPPAPPAPVTPNLLPFVITNNSGLPDSEVYIFVQGKQLVSEAPAFIDFDTLGGGQGSLHLASVGENGSSYTKPLSYFPKTLSGESIFYLPETDSFIVMISLHSSLSIPVIAGPKIQNPAYNDPNDPNGNFATIWDQVEGAYVNTGTNISVDATAVSFFSIPLYIYLSTPDPGSASNCGLTQSRSTILSYLQSVFSSVPPSPERAQWQSLFMHNGSTIYRALSPNTAIAGGFFDVNYLDNAATYGYSYIADIWSGPASFYKTHPSSLSIKIPSGSTYTGTVQPDNSIIFTSGPNTVTFGPPVLGPPYSTATNWLIFGGQPLYSSATIAADGVQVSKAFEEAIIAGIVPTTSLIDASTSNTLSSFRPYYQVNPNLSSAGSSIGPWYDLYSKALHACGLIYTYSFDEPLWPEVLLKSATLLPATYIGITIGNTQ